MAKGLTEDQVKQMCIIQQVCSVLSLLGCLFIIATFCLCDAFRKPINRLVFYASFGNVMASICFIMVDSFVDSPRDPGCQIQAFLLHTFVGADALWTLAMAVNVYLTFYHRFDAHRLRQMDWLYLVLCYGIPFTPAFIFIFIKNSEGQHIFGSAILWCWITPEWEILRIATFYGPIWGVIAVTLGIYIRSGGTIYRKRLELRKAQGSSSGATSSAHQSTVNNVKTTEIVVTSEPTGEPGAVQLHSMGHRASIQAAASNDISPSVPRAQATTSTGSRQAKAHTNSSAPRANVPRLARQVHNDINRAAWQYTKCALLFFAVILITWIPSSANRVYSHIHRTQVSVPLQFMSATVLPLQGFWNAIIYGMTSWEACKSLVRGKEISLGQWWRRDEGDRNITLEWRTVDESVSRSRRRSKFGAILGTDPTNSESMTELASRRGPGSEDGRSVSQP